MQIPMKILRASPIDVIPGMYAYKNHRGWVKWGYSKDILARLDKHKQSFGELPPITCIIYGATEENDFLIRDTLRKQDWGIPYTKDWFYCEEAMWEEVKRLAKILELEFYRLEIEVNLPLFTDGVHPYLA